VDFTFVVIQPSVMSLPASLVELTAVPAALGFTALTTSWLSTDMTPRVPMARRPARSLVAALSAEPTSFTLPRFVSTFAVRPSVFLLHTSFDLTADVIDASSITSP
jgi:hypothetical protein